MTLRRGGRAGSRAAGEPRRPVRRGGRRARPLPAAGQARAPGRRAGGSRPGRDAGLRPAGRALGRTGTGRSSPPAAPRYPLGTLVASGDLADLYARRRRRPRCSRCRAAPADNDLMAARPPPCRACTATATRGTAPTRRGWSRASPTRTPPAYAAPRTSSTAATASSAWPRWPARYPAGSTRATPPGCGGGCWSALGWAHRAGVVHGAVLPEHVLIHPGEHGLVLVDWCYSRRRPAQTAARAGRPAPRRYPPEVPAAARPPPATDIYLATGRCAG